MRKIMRKAEIRKAEIAIGLIVIASFIIAIYFYPMMPQRIASHWNAQGEVNGYMSKFWALFLVPFMSAGMLLLFIAIPLIDPLRENITRFRKQYDLFMVVFFLFMLYIYVLTILWNLGYRFSMPQLMSPGFGILMFMVGVMVQSARPNWFIGIRTPWTLSSETVWNKTHKLGGLLFKLCGIIALLGLLLPSIAIYFILIPVLIVAVVTVAYSYIVYKKEKAG